MSNEVIYLDERRKERWLRQINLSRETGKVAIFSAMQSTDAEIIPFPTKPEGGDAV